MIAWQTRQIFGREDLLSPRAQVGDNGEEGTIIPIVAGLVAGKRCVILGASSHRSIGWGIARALHREDADLSSCLTGEILDADNGFHILGM